MAVHKHSYFFLTLKNFCYFIYYLKSTDLKKGGETAKN